MSKVIPVLALMLLCLSACDVNLSYRQKEPRTTSRTHTPPTAKPGNSANAPGQQNRPGNSANAPGHNKDPKHRPGNSGNAPGQNKSPQPTVTTYSYRYYPSLELYFNVTTHKWYCYEHGSWTVSANVPLQFKAVLGTPVLLNLSVDHPRHEHSKIKLKHPGKAHGHKHKGKNKNKDKDKDKDKGKHKHKHK